MHETSLVQSLLTQVITILHGHPGSRVESIRVEIGPLSGVEPLLISSAFDRLVEATPCRGAALRIEQIDLTARCRDCGSEFVVPQFHFVCTSCASNRVTILRGDEFRLLDVTIDGDGCSGEGHQS
jgi:hydrogenase nickel incorporation protein HypA/HybF